MSEQEIIKEWAWKEWCPVCRRFHIVVNKPCPSCGVHYTPQPKSEKVYDKCHADYDCDGCQAYRDHTFIDKI